MVGSAVSGSMAPSTTTAPPLLAARSLSKTQLLVGERHDGADYKKAA